VSAVVLSGSGALTATCAFQKGAHGTHWSSAEVNQRNTDIYVPLDCFRIADHTPIWHRRT
jgi:hypothetical protein